MSKELPFVSKRSFGFVHDGKFIEGTMYRNSRQNPMLEAHLIVDGVDYETISSFYSDAALRESFMTRLRSILSVA